MQICKGGNFTKLHATSHPFCEVSQAAKSIYINIYYIIYITNSPIHEGDVPETSSWGDRGEVVNLGIFSLTIAPEYLKRELDPVKVHELHKLHGGGLLSCDYRLTRHLTVSDCQLPQSTQQSPICQRIEKCGMAVTTSIMSKRNSDRDRWDITGALGGSYLLGIESLALLVNSTKADNSLREMAGVTVHQFGDDGIVLVFRPPDLDKFSKIVGKGGSYRTPIDFGESSVSNA